MSSTKSKPSSKRDETTTTTTDTTTGTTSSSLEDTKNGEAPPPLTPEEETAVFQSLKVVASVKENQRLYTSGGGPAYYISLQGADESLLGVRRMLTGQTRDYNLNIVGECLQQAFRMVNWRLAQKERYAHFAKGTLSRDDLSKRMENNQRIQRSRTDIKAVLENIHNLSETTYRPDARARACIDDLKAQMRDFLDRTEASLRYLEKTHPETA